MMRLPSAALLLFAFASACAHLPPPHPRALENNELCAIKIREGDLVRADVYCNHGLEFSPQYADLWVNKGLIALKRGKDDEAKDHFIKALRYNQEQAQAYNNLGYVYYKQKSCGKAHDNFRRALKTNPDYLEARFNLALAYICMKEPAKARHELLTILAVNPNIADAHFNLGILALQDNKLDEAIGHLQQATQLDGTYADAWFNLGNGLIQAGRCEDARESFNSCIEADPANSECRNALALANRRCALLDPKLQEQKEERITENTPASLYELGRTYNGKGLRNEEERTYKKCLKLDGKYAPCHFGLHVLFSEDRRDRDAEAACKNFLKYALAEEFPRQIEQCEKYLQATR